MRDPIGAQDSGKSAASKPFAKRGRLADAVVEHLTNAIVSGVYPEGSALPIESDLCAYYEVSRTVIREVSTMLAEKGLIVSQQGRGTIVQKRSNWKMLDSLVLSALFKSKDGLHYLDNLIEIRLLLECTMTAKAVRKITDEQIAALQALLQRLGGLVDDIAAYSAADFEFHDMIMDISGNALGKAIITGIQGEALGADGYRGDPCREDILSCHKAHTAIVDAISKRQPDEAAARMHDHIEASWQHRRRTSDDAAAKASSKH